MMMIAIFVFGFPFSRNWVLKYLKLISNTHEDHIIENSQLSLAGNYTLQYQIDL